MHRQEEGFEWSLVNNVTHQHRFREELVRAKEHGIKLIILVEHGAEIQTMEDV